MKHSRLRIARTFKQAKITLPAHVPGGYVPALEAAGGSVVAYSAICNYARLGVIPSCKMAAGDAGITVRGPVGRVWVPRNWNAIVKLAKTGGLAARTAELLTAPAVMSEAKPLDMTIKGSADLGPKHGVTLLSEISQNQRELLGVMNRLAAAWGV